MRYTETESRPARFANSNFRTIPARTLPYFLSLAESGGSLIAKESGLIGAPCELLVLPPHLMHSICSFCHCLTRSNEAHLLLYHCCGANVLE